MGTVFKQLMWNPVRWLLQAPCSQKTENEDQVQDQTYKLQLLDKKSCKFDKKCTILSGG